MTKKRKMGREQIELLVEEWRNGRYPADARAYADFMARVIDQLLTKIQGEVEIEVDS